MYKLMDAAMQIIIRRLHHMIRLRNVVGMFFSIFHPLLNGIIHKKQQVYNTEIPAIYKM